MRNTTLQIIRSAVAADDSIGKHEATGLIDMIKKKDKPKTQECKELPVLLKQSEVAQLLSVSRQTVRRLTLEGKLHPITLRKGSGEIRPGDLLRFRRKDILCFAEGDKK